LGNNSYDQRYSQLQSVRENWCRNDRDIHDRSGATIELDGRELVDIPSFYLVLGHAVNGPDGYYGACLDALSDCLCGGFGLIPPFTLKIHHADAARESLGFSERKRWLESWAERTTADPDMTPRDLADLGLPLPEITPENYEPYFDRIISVLTDGGVSVVLDSHGT